MNGLTPELKSQIDNMPTIGYWKDRYLDLILVKRIEENYVLCVVPNNSKYPTYHRVKIQNTKTKYSVSRSFIVLFWQKFYLEDMLKI